MTTTQRPAPSIIRRRTSLHSLNVREVWEFRDLLRALIEKDIKLRYRQTALGVSWILLQPLLGAAIFSVVFHKVAGLAPPAGIPYFLLSFGGLLCWNAFNTSITRSSTAILQNAHLVSKVYFPRLLLPLSAGFGAVIDFVVGFAAFIVMLMASHVSLSWALCLTPLCCLLCVLLGVGLGFLSGAMLVWYRDVQYLLPVALQFLMYASPVAYTLDQVVHKVPEPLKILYLMNPMVGLIESFRSLAFGEPVASGILAYSVAMTAFVFVGGLLVFSRLERSFADVL